MIFLGFLDLSAAENEGNMGRIGAPVARKSMYLERRYPTCLLLAPSQYILLITFSTSRYRYIYTLIYVMYLIYFRDLIRCSLVGYEEGDWLSSVFGEVPVPPTLLSSLYSCISIGANRRIFQERGEKKERGKENQSKCLFFLVLVERSIAQVLHSND